MLFEMIVYKRVGILIVLLFAAILPVFGQDCTLSVSVTASDGGVICSGNNITLTATATGGTGPYSYVWSTGETTNTATVNRGGTYRVTVSDKTDGCPPVEQTITVTETTAPSAPFSQNVTVCKGTAATLTATGSTGIYNWYTTASGGTPFATGESIQTPPIQDQTFYWVETTVGACTSSRTLVIVGLTSNPSTQGSVICAGTTGTVSATGGDTYIWYDAPNGNQVGTGATYTSLPLTVTTTFYVVATSNGCSSAPTPATILVTPYPQAPTANNVSVCTGSTANLHASGAGVLDWFDVPSGGTSLITSPDYTTPALTETRKYWVQATNNGCASLRTEVTVVVNPIPGVPVPQPATICAGSNAVLTATPPAGGGTFNWFADAAGAQLLTVGDTYTTPALTSTTTYYLQTNNGGCVSSIVPLQVTVNPVPAAPATSQPAPICPNTTAVLTVTSPAGSYDWFSTPTGGTSLGNGVNFTTPQLAANTTFYVQNTVNGCVSTRTPVTVTILTTVPPPTANGVTVCPGSSARLTASGSANYQWYDSATSTTPISINRTWDTPPLTATTSYWVQTTAGSCSSIRKEVVVTVNPNPAAPTIAAITAICPGTAAVLTATVPDGGVVTWYDAPTGGSSLHTGNTFNTGTLYEPATYYVQNRQGDCLSGRTAVTVPVVHIDYPQFEYPSSTYCKSGGNATPTISDPTGGVFTATPAGLKFISATTGVVDIANSAAGRYTITFTGNESCHAKTQSSLNIVLLPNANFTYSGPYCRYGSPNPGPTFPGGASEGSFTATPTGLVFIDPATGVIDLQRSLPGTYTVTNTIEAHGTCPAVSAQTIVVIGNGVSVSAGPNQSVNAGAPVQLAGKVIGGATTGKWTGGAGSFSPDRNTLNAVYTPAANESSVTLTLTSDPPTGSCGPKSAAMTITVIPKPPKPTVTNPPVCNGNQTTLTATAPGGNYAWYDVPAGGTSIATGAEFTTGAITGTVTYYVQTTISGNTSDRTAVVVNVSPAPGAPVISPVQICMNAQATLTASGSPGTYEWYDVPADGVPLYTGNGFVTPAIMANTSYYVQAISAAGCPGPRVKVDVTVTPAPVFTSASTGTACSGIAQSYAITADMTGATFSWERPAVAGISNAAVAMHAAGDITEALINTGTSPINVTYNIVANGSGCSTPFAYVVTVNPLGSVTSPQSISICNGNALNYTVSFSNNQTASNWSRAVVDGIGNAAVTGQEATNIQEILHNNTNAPIVVPYVFNFAEGNCISTFTLAATVNPSVYITSATTGTACSTEPFVYDITSNVPSATFTWRREHQDGIDNAAVSNQTSSTINEALVNNTPQSIQVVYYITPLAFGCQGPEFPLRVIVNPKPPVPDANGPASVCEGDDIILNTSFTSTLVAYQWTGPDNFYSTDRNPVIHAATQAKAGTYKLSVMVNNNGCLSPAGTVNVVVVAPPVVDAGPDQIACPTSPEVINLPGKVTGDANLGVWKRTTGSGNLTLIPGTSNAQYVPSQDDIANGSVTLTLESTGVCHTVTDDVVIRFQPTPAVDAGADVDVCSKNVVNAITGKSIKGGPINWTTSGTGSFTPSATVANAYYVPSPADIAAGSVTLTLHYTNATVCDIPSDDMVMHFIPPPTVYTGETRYVLKGHQITLEPRISGSTAGLTYMWSPNINIDNPTSRNPVITGDIDRVYSLVVTDSRNCVSDPAQTFIKVGPVITIANTFTPNGDGTNDTWNITGLIAYEDASVDVFNRNGSQVFHSKGYPTAWDGTYNGQPLPAGTYYYVVHLNYDKNRVLSGSITILR